MSLRANNHTIILKIFLMLLFAGFYTCTKASAVKQSPTIALGTKEKASRVVAGINSIESIPRDATSLQMPTVPRGFTISVKASVPSGIISADGKITPPPADTTVRVILVVNKPENHTFAYTQMLEVLVHGTPQNVVQNSGFEMGDTSSWSLAGPDSNAVRVQEGFCSGDASKYALIVGKDSPFSCSISQQLDNLEDGTYTMKACVAGNSDNGTSKVYLYANEDGSPDRIHNISKCLKWTQVTMNHIVVTNGKCEIGMKIDGSGGSTWCLDHVEFYKTSSDITTGPGTDNVDQDSEEQMDPRVHLIPVMNTTTYRQADEGEAAADITEAKIVAEDGAAIVMKLKAKVYKANNILRSKEQLVRTATKTEVIARKKAAAKRSTRTRKAASKAALQLMKTKSALLLAQKNKKILVETLARAIVLKKHEDKDLVDKTRYYYLLRCRK